MNHKLLILGILVIIVKVGCSVKADDENHPHNKSSNVEMELGEETAHSLSEEQKEKIITFSIDKTDYHNDEFIKMKIKNNSDAEIEFGDETRVETQINNKWIEVRFTNVGVKDILYRLEPNTDFAQENHIVRYLKAGKYRLVQGISTDGEILDYEVYLISQTFEVSPD